MKLIKKLLAVTSVSLSLLAVAGCSDGNYSDFKYTEDNGTEISYINLDIESVSLVGSKKKAEQSVRPSVLLGIPCFAVGAVFLFNPLTDKTMK